MTIPRHLLSEAFGGNPRLVSEFEKQSAVVYATEVRAASTAQATEALEAATVVTLSPNATLTNERVLQTGQGITAEDDGEHVTIRIDEGAARVEGGFQTTFVASGQTTLFLPTEGMLVTRSGTEALENKLLVEPSITVPGNYVDDAAASAGGVPVGGVYRNGSQLMVRVA